MLERRPRVARVVEAERQQPLGRRPRASSPSSGSSALTTSSVSGKRRDRGAPALGDQLELAVAVELVAEQVAEHDRARADAPRDLGQRGLVDLEQAELARRAPRAAWRRRPRRGSRRSCCARAARAARRISAAIAAVVVLPFVAETSADPSGSRAARRSIAPGSAFQSSLPGRVVPPPRPASRETAPTARAPRISTLSGSRACTDRGYRAPIPIARSSELAVRSPFGVMIRPPPDLRCAGSTGAAMSARRHCGNCGNCGPQGSGEDEDNHGDEERNRAR